MVCGNWYVAKSCLLCLILVSLCLTVSGCWDRRELQDRNFVLAVAIDTAEQGDLGKGKEVRSTETFVQPYGSKKYRLSLQIYDVKPSQSQSDGKGAGKTATYVISNTGESMFEMMRDMLGQVDRDLWFEHIQTIVISEAVIKESGLQPLIDFFARDYEMRWRIKVFITSGEARKILEFQPPTGEAGGIYMANSVRLHTRTGHIPGARTDLIFDLRGLDTKTRILLPRIELADNMLKLSGMGVVDKEKFFGYVDEYSLKGGKIIFASGKSLLIAVECPEHPGRMAVFEVFRHDTKLTPHVEGEKIYFTLDIVMWGNLGELQCSQEHDTKDAKYLGELEQVFAEEVKRNTLYALDVFQKMGTDAILFNGKLRAHEPETWKKVKGDWDKIFPTIPMVVSVNVVIKGVGVHK